MGRGVTIPPQIKLYADRGIKRHPDTPMSKGRPNFLYSIQVCFEIGSLEFLVGLKLTKASYSRGLHYHTYSNGILGCEC